MGTVSPSVNSPTWQCLAKTGYSTERHKFIMVNQIMFGRKINRLTSIQDWMLILINSSVDVTCSDVYLL